MLGRRTVPLVAAVTFLVRLIGLTRPVRADEAGFELVARAWAPGPASVYGPYFVDRPPPVIALFKLSDAIGGPLFIRIIGALACAALVLAIAAIAAMVADERVAQWSAVAAATLVLTPVIDLVAAKGELLALPFLVGAIGLGIAAVRSERTPPAFAAGLLAAAAVGLKQNLAGAALFLGVLVLGSALSGRLTRAGFVRLAGSMAAGLAVPVVATLAWALVAGVHLATLWDAVYGFRVEAASVLGEGSATPTHRALVLLAILLGTGIAVAIAAYLARVPRSWRRDAPLTIAVLAMISFDVVALVVGGSFWQDYAFGLVPGALIAITLLSDRVRRLVVSAMVVSCVVCLAGWGAWNLSGQQEFDEHETGIALRDAAATGDTLVVFGGRADLQLTSGMPSPYRYLWSLPMRVRDPELRELRALVNGSDAPTWLVEWWAFDTWTDAGARLRADVTARYLPHGTACGGRTIWLLQGLERAVPTPKCR